jgi:DNA-directed RNA polymerase specialized sigma24 family protein
VPTARPQGLYRDRRERRNVLRQSQQIHGLCRSRQARGLITDHARNRQAQKRGRQFEITSLAVDSEKAVDHQKLSRIGEALDELAKAEPELAQIVDLRLFCGFSFGEIAAMRDVSERTVQCQWEKARIYLHGSIRTDLED